MTFFGPVVWGVLIALSLGACGDDDESGGTSGTGGTGGTGGRGGSAGADGAACAPAFDRIVLHTEFYSEGAAYGDFDRDGVTDVVAGPYWYAGPSFTARHELYEPVAFDPKGYSDNFFAWARDFNGDGWLDVLVVGFPGQEAAWFENPQSPDARWPRHLVFEGVDNEAPEYVDVTGDGAPELVFCHEGAVGWAAPAADPDAPWAFRPLSPPVGFVTFTHGLGVGDVDGDGRADVLEATGWWQQPAALDGDPLWARRDQPFVPGGAQMFAFDVDGDGDHDVVSTREAHGYGISWFEQAAEGFVERPIAPADPGSRDGPVLHEPHALARVDMNGDGLPDLVGGERFWGHVPEGDPSFTDPAKLYWFELERGAQGARFVPHLVDEQSGVGTQATAGDLNGDARPDIVIANKKGAFVFLQKPTCGR